MSLNFHDPIYTIYRCQLCGEEYTLTEDHVVKPSNESMLHSCRDGRYGVAERIGWQMKSKLMHGTLLNIDGE